MTLDQPDAVLYHLREMSSAGMRAHGAAAEDEGLTGPVRDLLFGLNSAVDALSQMIENAR
jgi:hypothetical protein